MSCPINSMIRKKEWYMRCLIQKGDNCEYWCDTDHEGNDDDDDDDDDDDSNNHDISNDSNNVDQLLLIKVMMLIMMIIVINILMIKMNSVKWW